MMTLIKKYWRALAGATGGATLGAGYALAVGCKSG